jgi:UDP-N-acetyl-2-amino-2-deoxyglucuronate dehydrogenase
VSGPLRVGIVGPGKGAVPHALAARALDETQLVAVCGRDPGRTGAFAAEHGATPFTELERMIAEARVELVIVCTPHPTHAEVGVRAARAGAHVLVEKPMALHPDDCERMIVAARDAGVRLGVVAQRRWYPPVRRMRDAIDRGAIGEPVLGTAVVLGWRSPEYFEMDPWRGTWAGEGGGVLVNQAVHQLDLLTWFLGPIADVHGRHANLNHPTIEVEDTAVATIRFGSGALGAVIVSNSQDPGLYARVHVHGRTGASIGVQTDGGSTFIAGVTTAAKPAVNDLWTVRGEEQLLAAWQSEDRASAATADPMTSYHRAQLRDFAGAVRDGREPAVTGEDGRRVVELIDAIYRSHATGLPAQPPRAVGPGPAT